MAKNSFILYHDQKQVFDELTDEQAGKLIKAIYEYNINGKVKLTGALRLVFIPFKTAFDRNNEKWDETAEKRSEAGKKHTGNQHTRKKQQDLEQMEQVFQNGTNGTVSVSVSGNVNDNVSVNVNDSVSVNIPDTPNTVFRFCNSIYKNYDESNLKKSCERFFKYYKEKEWQGINNWRDKLELWIDTDIDKGKIKEKDANEGLKDEAGFTHKNGRRVF